MPAAQTPNENCVAHKRDVVPIPGRDVMVHAWYQGGVSVFDWTDAEATQGDRVLRPRSDGRYEAGRRRTLVGVLDNGYIYGSEISRGLDVFELRPSAFLTAERDRRGQKTVRFDTSTRRSTEARVAGPTSPSRART